ncbi:MAG: phosphodiester glycosidase family protein [Eubacteriales bacterium]|nr:phosphodiester glycosidase family protein [Eubacteriales bacterium]
MIDNSHKSRKKKKRKLHKIFISFLCLIALGYITFVFIPIPFVRTLRDIWIETAMTTSHHKYLATNFIPANVINNVMSAKKTTISEVSRNIDVSSSNIFDYSLDGNIIFSTPSIARLYESTHKEIVTDLTNIKKDILGQAFLKVGEKDANGNTIFVNDIENGIVIIEIKKLGFEAKLALIADPRQVFVGCAEGTTYRGYDIQEYLEREDAILGMNASGFKDPEGKGLGTMSSGLTYSRGKSWSTYEEKYMSFGFDNKDNFVVGHFDNWDERNMRDGIQFNPALIVNGEDKTKDVTGWGLHPRTCIGQRSDGVVAFLVIDGRQVTTSIGGTIEQAAELLKSYGVVNAANCDGGASTILAYKGEIINNCSFVYANGRYLPNAFLVKSKETLEKELLNKQVIDKGFEFANDEDIPSTIELVDGLNIQTSVTTIEINNKQIKDLNFFKEKLKYFKNLIRIEFNNTNLSNDELADLREYLYPNIDVVWTLNIGQYKLKTNAYAFSTMVTPGDNHTRITSKDIEVLKYCTNLYALDIGHQAISDLSFIGEVLSDLRVLILVDNQITDLSPLSNLKKLHYLEVYVLGDDIDLSPLNECKGLVDLQILYKSEIKNIDSLLDFPKIERLWLMLCEISNENMDLLKEKYPNAQVINGSEDLKENGWRDVDRFFIMRDMFSNDYISEEFLRFD